MYDTVAAVLGEVPREVLEPRRWQKGRDVTDHETGEVVRTFTTNADGLLLTLHGGGRALKAERSLPKAYRGENISDLHGPAVAVALGVVDGEIADALGCWSLPPIAEWLPVRVDYPRSVALGDEDAVLRTLETYSEIEMPYKGLPVVGQSHSVTWAKGDIRLKAYGKYRETRGDARARGVLRIEPGVFRARAFRALLRIEPSASLTLLDALTPGLHETVHAKFESRLRGDVMTAKEIGDLELFREMLAMFGARRTATLMGWAAMWVLSGVESRADMLAVNLGSLQTRYRVLADYRQLRARVRELNYALSEVGSEESDIEDMVRRLGSAA
jgi:hypothetical protein